jgi:hypothetical protein
MGSAKTDTKIVAHAIGTVPNRYNLSTMQVLGKEFTYKDILKLTREQNQSCWKFRFENQNTRRSHRYNNTRWGKASRSKAQFRGKLCSQRTMK